MRTRWGTLLVAVAVLGACGGQAVQVGREGLPSTRWQGTVTSPTDLAGAVEMQGTAYMIPGQDLNTTEVVVELENAAPGGQHPWEVRTGRCGTQVGGSFGNSENFDYLEIERDGTGRTQATVEQPLPDDGQYSIVVFASPTNRDLVVACGNLAPPVN